MAANSAIEWTDASWTPLRARNRATGKVGWHCEHATTGCEFCYAEDLNKWVGTGLPFKPGHRKDIDIFLDEEMLRAPLRWKKPRMIFVCSMTDLFADFVSIDMIARMFVVMDKCPQHTFQILTKRADRMSRVMPLIGGSDPLPNVWLGVSAEDQERWDERKEHLRNTPAAVHFASFEPLLGGIVEPRPMSDYIQWAIVGGESGSNARPMHPDWARSLQKQCEAAGVAFFFKQWGRWFPFDQVPADDPLPDIKVSMSVFDGQPNNYRNRAFDIGKKAAGRLLDGKEHSEFPATAAQAGAA